MKVVKKYVKTGCFEEEERIGLGDKFSYYVEISNTEAKEEPVCQVGLVHGFSEDSDQWLELGYQMALNNILVHIIDLEGFGYSSGQRCLGPIIPNLHFNITSLLEQFRPGLPSFLYGNSMGCMTLNTYLLRNPNL